MTEQQDHSFFWTLAQRAGTQVQLVLACARVLADLADLHQHPRSRLAHPVDEMKFEGCLDARELSRPIRLQLAIRDLLVPRDDLAEELAFDGGGDAMITRPEVY
jgi:hypothetical protein